MAERDANSTLVSAAIGHQIALLAYGNGVGRDLATLLADADDDLLTFLSRHLRDLLRATPVAQRERRAALRAALREINQAAYDEVAVVLLAAMALLAGYEATFQAELLSRVTGQSILGTLTEAERLAVLERPVLGRTLAEAIQDAAERRLLHLETAIGTVLGVGGTVQDALDLIEGAEDGAGGSVLETAKDWAQTLARTDTVGVADAAGQVVYERSGVVEVTWWASVLDNSTTPLCRAQSGATRPVGGGEWSTGYRGPDPPAHYNCRSVLVPLVSTEVPNLLTFPEWLAEQPVEEQIEILGVTRHRLWKDGRLPITSFVNDFGKTLSLSALAERDAEAFRRAGL